MIDLIEFLENIDDRIAGFVILIIMIIQSPILIFPGYLLMIYSGFKFGLVIGTLINFIGLYLSCIIGYRFGKWSSTDFSKIKNQRMQKFHHWVQEKGIKVVIILRLWPLIPNNVTSVGSGISRIPERQHSLFSTLAIIQSFVWSFIGTNFLNTFIGDLRLELNYYYGIILLVLLGILIFFRTKLANVKE